MRKVFSAQINNIASFKKNLLNWASSFQKYCVLDSNQWNGSTNDLIAGVGSLAEVMPISDSFEVLKKFHALKKDWLFGYLSYDLKNEVEKLSSENFDGLGFPQMHFFQPEYVFILRGEKLEIHYFHSGNSEEKIELLFQEILTGRKSDIESSRAMELSARVSKEEYLSTVKKIKQHITRGDIYEMNYCMEFFSSHADVDPIQTFLKLSDISEAPFSALLRTDDKYLVCASPERYLKKEGDKIISQPIKGTARRGETIAEDFEIKKMLSQNEKEKSENVMIVDLVRNDLSKTCSNVAVKELFRVYTFKQWHQMISTITGELRDDFHFTDVIKDSFPMGSMTGAPKVRAMELIEQYEKTKRGLYSGAVGYITPEANFDLNVVIRSILYNKTSNYLSFQVGSAITANSVPEKEYEECLLKAIGMFEALTGKDEVQGTRYEVAATLNSPIAYPTHG
jgi:para-aminobenzoate synthetase component 1